MQVKALPQISTLKLNPADRAMGRLANIQLPEQPEGQSDTDLAGDIFFEMFQSQPQALADVPQERSTNRALLDWMQGTHGWEASRTSTIANMPASMAASGLMWAHLNNDETIKEALKKQEEASQTAQQAKAVQNTADVLKQTAQQTGNKQYDKQAQQMAAQARQLAEQAAQAAAEANALVQDTKGKPLKNAAMMAAAQAAAKEAQNTAEAMAGWGMGPGSHIYTDPKAAQEFLQANKGKIARIAKLAGRLRGFALQARRERVVQGVVPAEVGFTQDLMRVFPTELALLRPDAPATLRAEKMAQFVETGLLGYKPMGEAEKRGPFVGAVDVSPSMRTGDREVVAKAIALGLAQAAKVDGRPYILFAFASDSDTVTAVTSNDDWAAHVKWAAASQGGGTDFDMALDETMNRLRQLGKQSKGADALFVSDGEAGVQTHTRQTWKQFAQETGARLFYVPVSRGGYADIEDTADQVIHLDELNESTGADVAAAVGRWM